ncbi:DUF2061 domain-containing protein [Massilia phyllosphaerae]|uniref:DUF2061 domain-containing protein n=1 Tax=Massilia phyllosphaerae TaxID=3106034 RepID=UPI002B1CB142|nr:DUF2061 domain-containing protein [Massilia sp. SGZ-792]
MAVARKTSQILTHLAIGFVITYAVTGSVMLGGLAILIEPLLNVLLVPFHERAWERKVHSAKAGQRLMVVTLEKISLTAMHMGVAFTVIFFATGSMAFGGLAAILEPVCNVLLMPFHDKLWDNLESGQTVRTA